MACQAVDFGDGWWGKTVRMCLVLNVGESDWGGLEDWGNGIGWMQVSESDQGPSRSESGLEVLCR